MNKNFYCKVTLAFFLFLGNPIYSKCIDGKVRWLHNNKEKEEEIAYCFEKSDQLHSWITKKCLQSNSKCKIWDALKSKDKKPPLKSMIGNPAFHACHRLNGLPQIAKYWDGKKWVDFERCIFDDNSSIDISYIFHIYKSRVIN